MNTTMSTTRPGPQQQHPPSPTLQHRAPTRHVRLIDRLALRLGVALVAWSRRPRLLDDRDERARRVRMAQANERRERSMQRDALLTLPPR